MSDKITTKDCVKAICDHWAEENRKGNEIPGELSELTDPKLWKRVKKMGNAATGFIRLFRNVKIDEACAKADAERCKRGCKPMIDRLKWVAVTRATDDEVYDVSPGALLDGEYYEDESKAEAVLRKIVSECKVEAPVPATVPASSSDDDESEIDDEKAWREVFGEGYKKFPTDGFFQPIAPPAEPIPGGAIHEVLDKEYHTLERASKKHVEFDLKRRGYIGKKEIKPGTTFLFISPDDGKPEDVITFPKGGTAYIDCEQDEVGDDFSAVDDLYLEDDVGNVWYAGGEPGDDTDRLDKCFDTPEQADDLKRVKDAIAKYKADVVMRHM